MRKVTVIAQNPILNKMKAKTQEFKGQGVANQQTKKIQAKVDELRRARIDAVLIKNNTEEIASSSDVIAGVASDNTTRNVRNIVTLSEEMLKEGEKDIRLIETVISLIEGIAKETFDIGTENREKKLANVNYSFFKNMVQEEIMDFGIHESKEKEQIVNDKQYKIIKDFSIDLHWKGWIKEDDFGSGVTSFFQNLVTPGKKHYFVNPKLNLPKGKEEETKKSIQTLFHKVVKKHTSLQSRLSLEKAAAKGIANLATFVADSKPSM